MYPSLSLPLLGCVQAMPLSCYLSLPQALGLKIFPPLPQFAVFFEKKKKKKNKKQKCFASHRIKGKGAKLPSLFIHKACINYIIIYRHSLFRLGSPPSLLPSMYPSIPCIFFFFFYQL